jgi:hypothetical protein
MKRPHQHGRLARLIRPLWVHVRHVQSTSYLPLAAPVMGGTMGVEPARGSRVVWLGEGPVTFHVLTVTVRFPVSTEATTSRVP